MIKPGQCLPQGNTGRTKREEALKRHLRGTYYVSAYTTIGGTALENKGTALENKETALESSGKLLKNKETALESSGKPFKAIVE